MSRIEAAGITYSWLNPVTGIDTPSRGLSPALPWKTRQYAWDFMLENFDAKNQQVYFNMFDADPVTGVPTGTPVVYTDEASFSGRLVGQGGRYPVWRGIPYVSDSSPWNVQVHTSGHAWNLFDDCVFGVDGVAIKSDAGCGVFSQWGSRAQMFRNIMADCHGAHMEATKDAWVFQNGSDDPHKPAYLIWGAAPIHVNADLGRVFVTGGDRSVCTVYGTPNFDVFAFSIEGGYATSHTMQWSGPGWTYNPATKLFALTPHGIVGKKHSGDFGGSMGHGFNGQGPSGTTSLSDYWPGTIAGTVNPPGFTL